MVDRKAFIRAWRETFKKTLKANLEKLDRLEEAQALLAKGGIELKFDPYNLDNIPKIPIKLEDLPKVYRLLGSVECSGKDLVNQVSKLINVYVRPRKYPEVCFKYQK